MTAANNIINILQPYLKKIESVYKRVLILMILTTKRTAMQLVKGSS